MLLIDANIFIYLHKAKALNKLKDLTFCYCKHISDEVIFLKELFPLNLIQCNANLIADLCIIELCKTYNYSLLTADKALKKLAIQNLISLKTISRNHLNLDKYNVWTNR